MDRFFTKKDNMKAAMDRFGTTTDEKEIIMHMQEPVQFEIEVFKKAFFAKLDEFIVEAQNNFVQNVLHVSDKIIEILEEYKKLLSGHEATLTREKRMAIIRHIYCLVLD